MEEIPKENTIRFGGETEHDFENSNNGKNKQSDDDNEEQSDHGNGKHCDNGNYIDVNSDEKSFLFTEVDSSIDLMTEQFKNPLVNVNVQI